MAKNEQSRLPRKRASAKPAKVARVTTAKSTRPTAQTVERVSMASSRPVTRNRSESAALRRPRRGSGEQSGSSEQEVLLEETVSTETRAPQVEPPEARQLPPPEAPPSTLPAEAGPTSMPSERRGEAERVVRELLGHMGFAARLELKDTPEGGLAMAVHFEGEPPAGVQAGRRTPVMDALQLIANKLFNAPGMERRWLSLGAHGFPEPRVPGVKKPALPVAPQAPAAPAPRAPAPQDAGGSAAHPTRPERPAHGGEPDERALEVTEDASMAQEARALAERSASRGRFFALLGMDGENRARVLRAAEGVAGVRVHVEGEGRHRRVVFRPEKPAPLPKRNVLPDWDDDEDEDI